MKELSVYLWSISVFVFLFAMTTANAAMTAGTDLTSPILKAIDHTNLDSVRVGQLLLITTILTETEEIEKPFVVIVEARDETGVTILLQFQIGRLTANGQSEVGVSWRPETAGEYELRAFVISDFTNPEILTGVRTSQVAIGST
jgi:hypothetical protein